MNKICLCCGQKIDKEKAEKNWHRRCVKDFFGIESFPKISFSNTELEKYAIVMLSKGNTVAGVQKKFSLHLESEKEARLTLVGYPAGYILKPSVKEYANLPELEFCTMIMARQSGIQVASAGIIDGNYITKRMDRDSEGKKYAMEDFCQISEKLTESKYKGSYEGCGKIIKQYSMFPGVDIAEFFQRIIFCFVIGNSDMHLKNFSLIEKSPGSREYYLSKAYDLLPVNIILPEDEEETALTLNGKKSKLKRTDFLEFGKNLGLKDKTVNVLIERIIGMKEKYFNIIKSMPIENETKNIFVDLVEKRISRLGV